MTRKNPLRRKRTRIPRRPATARKVSGWWVGVPVIAVLLLAAGLILFLRHGKETGKPLPVKPPAATSSESDEALVDPADWKGPLPAEIARLFTETKTHEERLELIASPQSDGYWMEKFFREGAGAKEKVSSVTPMGPASTDTASFERFQVSLEDGGNRLLCILITGEGGKVDFRSYARFGTESWEDLLSGKTNIAEEVRVFIEPGTAYLHGYSDDLAWTSYIATSRDLEEPLYFYAARDSEADRQLAEMTAGGPMRATLAIRSIGDAYRHRQFEVTEAIHPGWVNPR